MHRFALFSNRLMVKQHETTVVCCYKMFHVERHALTRSDSLGLLNLQSLEPDQDVICCADLLLDARSMSVLNVVYVRHQI